MKKKLHFKLGALGLAILILSSTALAACSSVNASGKIDLNNMTPLDSLNKLNELIKKAKQI